MFGRDADADDDDVGLDGAAVGQPHPLDAIVAVESVDADAEPQVDAVIAMDVAAQRAHLLAEHPPERHRQRLDHRDVEATFPRRRRDLGADEARRRRRPPEGCARIAPKRDASRRVCAGCRARRARACSGSWRGEEPVAMSRPSNGTALVARRARAIGRARSSAGGADAQLQIEVELGEPVVAGRAACDLELPLAREQLLRQRRPVVGRCGLVADHGDRPVVAVVAERLGAPQPGERRADDGDRVAHGAHRRLRRYGRHDGARVVAQADASRPTRRARTGTQQ